jgi:hypothetical protein
VPDHRHEARSSGADLRERAGVALLRIATDLATDRRATVLRVAATPAHTPGRDRALGALAFGAWVESALLWVGWRLVPRDALPDRASPPCP